MRQFASNGQDLPPLPHVEVREMAHSAFDLLQAARKLEVHLSKNVARNHILLRNASKASATLSALHESLKHYGTSLSKSFAKMFQTSVDACEKCGMPMCDEIKRRQVAMN